MIKNTFASIYRYLRVIDMRWANQVAKHHRISPITSICLHLPHTTDSVLVSGYTLSFAIRQLSNASYSYESHTKNTFILISKAVFLIISDVSHECTIYCLCNALWALRIYDAIISVLIILINTILIVNRVYYILYILSITLLSYSLAL